MKGAGMATYYFPKRDYADADAVIAALIAGRIELTDGMDDDQAEEAYSEILDEAGPVRVADQEFDPSRILQELDPTAFRAMVLDWLDAEYVDVEDTAWEAVDPFRGLDG